MVKILHATSIAFRSICKTALRLIQNLLRPAKPPVNPPRVLEAAHIGKGSRIYGILDRVNPQLIHIGSNCVLGVHAAILTHCPIRGGMPVRVEDEVWIGFNAVVLPGVTIGTGSIIGACAVVTKDVPPGSIVAGNPAKVIRSLTDEESKQLVYRLRNRLPMS